MTRRARGPTQGKPVLISISAFSLVFHAVTPGRSGFRENPTYISTYIPYAEYVVLFVERLMAREVRCHGMD